MENCRVELTAGGQTLTEVKIQRGIFHGDLLSSILVIIVMIPLNYWGGYKFTKLQEKINHLIYIDDIKIFAKNKKHQETLIHTIRLYG